MSRDQLSSLGGELAGVRTKPIASAVSAAAIAGVRRSIAGPFYVNSANVPGGLANVTAVSIPVLINGIWHIEVRRSSALSGYVIRFNASKDGVSNVSVFNMASTTNFPTWPLMGRTAVDIRNFEAAQVQNDAQSAITSDLANQVVKLGFTGAADPTKTSVTAQAGVYGNTGTAWTAFNSFNSESGCTISNSGDKLVVTGLDNNNYVALHVYNADGTLHYAHRANFTVSLGSSSNYCGIIRLSWGYLAFHQSVGAASGTLRFVAYGNDFSLISSSAQLNIPDNRVYSIFIGGDDKSLLAVGTMGSMLGIENPLGVITVGTVFTNGGTLAEDKKPIPFGGSTNGIKILGGGRLFLGAQYQNGTSGAPGGNNDILLAEYTANVVMDHPHSTIHRDVHSCVNGIQETQDAFYFHQPTGLLFGWQSSMTSTACFIYAIS